MLVQDWSDSIVSVQVLQRTIWDGIPKKQADFVPLRKAKDSRELEAVAELWNAPLWLGAHLIGRLKAYRLKGGGIKPGTRG